jgi:hypothetical protein
MRNIHIATFIALIGVIAVIRALTQSDIKHVASNAASTQTASVSALIAQLPSSFTTTYAKNNPRTAARHAEKKDRRARGPENPPLRLVYSNPHPMPASTRLQHPRSHVSPLASKVATLPKLATPTPPALVTQALGRHQPKLKAVHARTERAPHKVWPPKLTLLSVLPATIRRGTSATLCVIARGARILRVSGLGSLDPNHADCVAVAPQNSTTYIATATNASDRSTRRSVTLTVIDASAPASAAATNDASTP